MAVFALDCWGDRSIHFISSDRYKYLAVAESDRIGVLWSDRLQMLKIAPPRLNVQVPNLTFSAKP